MKVSCSAQISFSQVTLHGVLWEGLGLEPFWILQEGTNPISTWREGVSETLKPPLGIARVAW